LPAGGSAMASGWWEAGAAARMGFVMGIQVSTAPAELDLPTGETDVRPDRPWVVIVWNDPINLMAYVALVFQKLFGYSKEKANSLMMDVHHKGRAVVSSGTREKAEIDVFRLHEHGLWATMQQDD
jgi:ATP-dependent Clp protease adaptor protein ClpS